MDLESVFWLARIPIVFCLLAGYHYRQRSAALRRLWAAVAVTCILVFGAHSVRLIASGLIEEEAWDFLCFWLAGTVAVAGETPYEPANFHKVSLPFEVSDSFEAAILDVGFWYPPPSIFLVAPFGWLDYQVAYLLWQVLNLAAMLGCIALLATRSTAPETRRCRFERLGLTACLVLLLPATVYTLEFAQTNFPLLLAVLVLWHRRSQASGGLALALGCIVKPVMAVFMMPVLLQRSWKALGTAAVVLASLATAATLTWGAAVWQDFLSSRHRVPEWVLTESVNQSLMAAVSRLSPHDEPMRHPVYVLAALALVAANAWLIVHSRSTRSLLPWLLTLLTGLLVYPGTLNHYMVLLLAPMIYLWRRRHELPIHAVGLAIVLAATYALLAFRHGSMSIIAAAGYWLCFFALGLRPTHRGHRQRVSLHRSRRRRTRDRAPGKLSEIHPPEPERVADH